MAVNRTEAQGDFTKAERDLSARLHPQIDTAIRRVTASQEERDAREALAENVCLELEGYVKGVGTFEGFSFSESLYFQLIETENSLTVQVVPEPSTGLLLLCGILLLLTQRRKSVC